MTTTHTAAPWHVAQDGDVYGPDFHPHASTRIAVVEKRHAISLTDSPQTMRLRAEANARLIAAAPELLAALNAMVNEFGGSPTMRKYLNADITGNKVVLDAIAAIEKVAS